LSTLNLPELVPPLLSFPPPPLFLFPLLEPLPLTLELLEPSSFQSVKQINYVLSIISKKKILGKIASSMSLSRRELTHKINNLCLRRHQIAHNSDIPCESNKEESISFEYIQESIKLISDFINEMHKFIKL